MDIIFLFLCTIISFASSATVKWESITDTYVNSTEQEPRSGQDGLANLIYRLEVTAKLPENSTVSEQNQCVFNFLEILENKIDNIRKQRRQEQEKNSDLVSLDSNAPYKKNVKKFSVHDIAEIFPVFKIEISPQNNLAFTAIMTDKVYSELNKQRVRTTSWFPKVLAEVHSLPENKSDFKEFRTFFSVKTKDM